jgi:hypothetical protein
MSGRSMNPGQIDLSGKSVIISKNIYPYWYRRYNR